MKIVLTCDETLTGTYRDIPLLDFLPCAPSEKVPSLIFNILNTQLEHKDGVLEVAPYSIRKVEASLLKRLNRSDVTIAHPSHVHKFIDDRTDIVGVSTMDPLGLGPVSMMFTLGGLLTSYSKKKFTELVKGLKFMRIKNGYRYKIVVGGPGSWQLALTGRWRELGVDHIVVGETDHVINDIFEQIVHGNAPEVIHVKSFPKVEEISTIVNPSYKGMVEVMRGCGRNCKFCEPNLRAIRFIPAEKILDEVRVNLKHGIYHGWLHSEDIFLYKLRDFRNFYPNSEEVVGLFRSVMSMKGMKYVNPTHGSIAPVAADPLMVENISKVVGANAEKWIGIQVGMEFEEFISKVDLGDPRYKVELNISLSGGNYFTDPSLPLVQNFRVAIEKVTGKTIPIAAELGGNDGRYTSAKGIPTICYGPIRNDTNFHGVNEFVWLDDIKSVRDAICWYLTH